MPDFKKDSTPALHVVASDPSYRDADVPEVKFYRMGEQAWLVDYSDCSDPLARSLTLHRVLTRELNTQDMPRRETPAWHSLADLFLDVVPAAHTVLVRFGSEVSSDRALTELQQAVVDANRIVESQDEKARTGQTDQTVHIPVHYDGPDLAAVAQHLGCDEAGVIQWHTSTSWVAAFGGFAPGFFYLTPVSSSSPVSSTCSENSENSANSANRAGSPKPADSAAPGIKTLSMEDSASAPVSVPRLHTPRTQVPAGAVGLAGQFSAVYPRQSPGGWQLIGRTDAVMWDEMREDPALLSPGTIVIFDQAR